jgi:hypothetical protein
MPKQASRTCIVVHYTDEGSTKLYKIQKPPQNYSCKKGDKRQVPYSGPTNFSCHGTKFGCPEFSGTQHFLYFWHRDKVSVCVWVNQG